MLWWEWVLRKGLVRSLLGSVSVSGVAASASAAPQAARPARYSRAGLTAFQRRRGAARRAF